MTAYQCANNNYAYKGYFNYQFFENEKDVFPWKKMNYLGKKRILNLGVGFHYQPEAMKSFATVTDTPKKHDLLLVAADLFLELPLKNNSSFTSYLVWYNYDFGTNYLKSGGLMNNGTGGEINGQPLLQGGGNAEWSHGTGNIFHAETGYLLPDMKWMNGKQLQFFAGYTYKDLEALGCSLNNFDFGLNYFLFGNNVKCGLQYSSRPVYNGTIGDNATGEIHSYKGTIIFNTQIDF